MQNVCILMCFFSPFFRVVNAMISILTMRGDEAIITEPDAPMLMELLDLGDTWWQLRDFLKV